MELKLKENINNYYIPERVSEVDKDFLTFEEDMISTSDVQMILDILSNKTHLVGKLPNPHNSILLYLTGITNTFDKTKARSDTIDGSPPDVDVDLAALERDKVIQWIVNHWGREQVANIITHGTFKPKSLARAYYRVTEGDGGDLAKILKMIPPAKYGKEATLEEIVELHPELSEEECYTEFYTAAQKLENMISNFGIHAGGLIISDFPISDVVPIWKNSKADAITQYDKNETEELGLLKFDLLSIDTLSIIKDTLGLIKRDLDIDIEPYTIPDGDTKAYKMMNAGLLTGVFQMETSGNAKRLFEGIQPQSIKELSDISALNRPGPAQAGLDRTYMDNKKRGSPPSDLPEPVAEILKGTYWTLVYQEQIMNLCSKLAGFTLQESDDIRRALGKKKKEILDSYEKQFVEGCKETGLEELYAKNLWEELLGFADYCLAGDTQVQTSEGYVAIEDLINRNDSPTVLSVDNEGNLIYQDIVQKHNNGIMGLYEYTLEDNTRVKCTKNHKFMTATGSMIEIDSAYRSEVDLLIKE